MAQADKDGTVAAQALCLLQDEGLAGSEKAFAKYERSTHIVPLVSALNLGSGLSSIQLHARPPA